MKYAVRHDVYPQLHTFAPDGSSIVFEDFEYETEDADLARSLIHRDDIKLVRGKLPSLKKTKA